MFQYTFMQYAFVVSLFIAVLCPLIGIFLVLRKYAFIGDVLSHASLAGVGIGLATGISPIWSAFLFASFAGILLEALRNRFKERSDLVMSIILAFFVGIAISLMSSNLVQGNVESYLFGSLLTVSKQDVLTIVVLNVCAIVAFMLRYHHLLYLAIDEEIAEIAGVRTKVINYLFSILTALSIAVAIKLVGMLVIGSLLVLPVATALQLRVGFKKTLFYSIAFSLFDIIGGLILSYYLNIAPGGFIVLLSVFVLLCMIVISNIRC